MSPRATFLAFLIGYPILCLLPFFIGALNDPTSKILGIPITVVYPIFIMLVFCGVLYWAAEKLWRTPSDKDE